MTALPVAAAGDADPRGVQGFGVGYVSEEGVEHEVPMAEAWAVPFECGMPVRRFTSRKGQRHLSGLWWCATTGGHIGFESWLERDQLVALDFDPTVVGIASQPFWLHWTYDAGERVSHAPDYFARRRDGSAVVIDCRPVERRKPRDVAKFDATAKACGLVGWEYRLVGAPDPVVTANLRWLAGYRHSRHRVPATADALLELFERPTPLMVGAGSVGDPIAVLPVLFHLLWCHELGAELSAPLHQDTLVGRAVVPR